MRFLRTCFVLMVAAGIIFTSVPSLYADETSEIILRLLVKKGIISQEEIDEIKKEITREEPAVPEGLEDRVAKLEKGTPKWIKDFKLKGDLRLRNEMESNNPGKDNNCQRIRFRLGATAEVNDQVEIGFGLATGGTGASSATSTNQTLDDSFTTKDFDLDYAYAAYKPCDSLYLIGGKFKSLFFHTDMLWDSDIRFEGVAGKLTHKLAFLSDGDIPTKAFLAAGYFPLENISSSARDPYLLAGQIGSETKFKEIDSKLKTGLAFYDFKSVEGQTTLTGDTNSTNIKVNGMFQDYRVVSPTLKYSAPSIFGVIDISNGLLLEFAQNTGVSNENEAWRYGGWLGESKVKKQGQWKLLGQYSRVEADAFLDIFPDGDFNDAGTNAKGWEFIFDYGLADNVILSFDYYNTETVSGGKSDDEILQADLIFNF